MERTKSEFLKIEAEYKAVLQSMRDEAVALINKCNGYIEAIDKINNIGIFTVEKMKSKIAKSYELDLKDMLELQSKDYERRFANLSIAREATTDGAKPKHKKHNKIKSGK